MGVGVQLYSLRDAMAADPIVSLKKVADMGYKFIRLFVLWHGVCYLRR